jgi:hypothetical protein
MKPMTISSIACLRFGHCSLASPYTDCKSVAVQSTSPVNTDIHFLFMYSALVYRVPNAYPVIQLP